VFGPFVGTRRLPSFLGLNSNVELLKLKIECFRCFDMGSVPLGRHGLSGNSGLARPAARTWPPVASSVANSYRIHTIVSRLSQSQ
jgi:hypothetical protein